MYYSKFEKMMAIKLGYFWQWSKDNNADKTKDSGSYKQLMMLQKHKKSGRNYAVK